MKKRTFSVCMFTLFFVEIAIWILYLTKTFDFSQNTVLVNEIVQSVKNDWENINNHIHVTDMDYVVLNKQGTVLYRTKSGLSETINAAVAHRDTILDIEINDTVKGRIIIWNTAMKNFGQQKRGVFFIFSSSVLIQAIILTVYVFYLNQTMIKPFHGLKKFAERVAGGNLDVPLEMDRQNVFGAFTESFDLMRSELKKARIAEAKANADKKELVAKLSHDIKTPVASIKAASELGYAIAENQKIKENYKNIIQKANQINTLITNLFMATLKELKHLSVTSEDIESREVIKMLENSDYLHRAELPVIPECLLYADRIRLQQVFDNIFANSYKYADTRIQVSAKKEAQSLCICIEDYGKGVKEKELPVLKEKYMRGSNTGNIEGAGLGLYISDSFMKEMGGNMVLENGADGLKVTVKIALSGVSNCVRL